VINPFRNTIVADPWNPGIVDVYEINAGAFQLCCQALDRVRAEGRSTSVLLYGEAGSGKTHLLARLRSYLKDQAQLFIFVAVRLHTSPNRLWRHIRKSFVESLLQSIKGNRSQLEFVFMRINKRQSISAGICFHAPLVFAFQKKIFNRESVTARYR
jgi:chromosomal replication initiation ATPase DnaA